MEKKENTDKRLPEVKLHIWFEKDGGVYFGQGRYELLSLIEELGSLKLAAEKLEMSYRGAWGKIKKTEEVIGVELIYKENNKEGYKLTEFGKHFLSEFRKFHEDVSQYARVKGEEILSRFISG